MKLNHVQISLALLLWSNSHPSLYQVVPNPTDFSVSQFNELLQVIPETERRQAPLNFDPQTLSPISHKYFNT